MNDEMRKALTKCIGEEWIDPLKKSDPYNRPFTTPDDAHDVFKALVDKGDWETFCKFCELEWENKNHYVDFDVAIFTRWLFLDPEHFCALAGEWMMKEGK